MNLPQLDQSVSQTGAARLNIGQTAGDAIRTPGDHPPIASLYIHTPFCVHKCHYCDFYSFVDTRDQQAAFVDRLIDELRTLAPHAGPLETVFVGGGTPSLLRVDLWERLLGELRGLFDLSRMGTGPDGGEFTVECNPESTTDDLLAVLRAGGVNRVSIGAQSFHLQHLKTLERWHNPENVGRAVELARAAGIARQSVDLIFAIPGQTIDEWATDLDRALALNTTHLSCYNLTYEPNTAMTKRLELGEFEPTSDELEAEMYALTVQTLATHGLHRYEVSNFARPGHESLHNLAYWRQEQWLAAGPSASGHVLAGKDFARGSYRFKNVPRLGDYLASSGFSPVIDLETPDPARLIRERIMMGIRLAEGLDASALLADATAISTVGAQSLTRAAESLRDQGLLTIARTRWTLTDAGFMVGDSAAADLMDAFKP